MFKIYLNLKKSYEEKKQECVKSTQIYGNIS